jgi:hypothetical protein
MYECAAMEDGGRPYGGNKNENKEEKVHVVEHHRGTEPESMMNEVRRE